MKNKPDRSLLFLYGYLLALYLIFIGGSLLQEWIRYSK